MCPWVTQIAALKNKKGIWRVDTIKEEFKNHDTKVPTALCVYPI